MSIRLSVYVEKLLLLMRKPVPLDRVSKLSKLGEIKKKGKKVVSQDFATFLMPATLVEGS